MKILKALSLSFALGVLALGMLGAGGTSKVMPATKSGRPFKLAPAADAGAVDAGPKQRSHYMNSTKSGELPLVGEP